MKTTDLHYIHEVKDPIPWPDPTPAMLKTSKFKAVWECIKTWDICVPKVDGELYSGATGNHVRAILDALGERENE